MKKNKSAIGTLFFMYSFINFAKTNCKEGEMNDIKCLLGIGLGMIAGAMLYKYSICAKKIIDQGEKKVMQEVENMPYHFVH